MKNSMRLFVAAPVCEELIRTVIHYRPAEEEGVILVRPDLFHMTLQFIGNEDPEKVKCALQDISFQAFTTKLTATGIFSPKKNKKILWLGIKLNGQLASLQNDISSSLLNHEIKIDAHTTQKSYKPHITLARCKRSINKTYLETFLNQEIKPCDYPIDRFCLYHSYQRKGQLQYEAIQTYHCKSST